MNTDQQNIRPANWVNNYADGLYAYAFSKTSKQELSEDLVQDTFLSALNSLPSFKGASSEKTWLFSILKNKITDYYRKASTRNELSENIFFNEGGPVSFLSNFFEEDGHWRKTASPHKWNTSTSDILENKELMTALTNCLDKLPGNWNTVITEKFIEEKESEEICKELNLSSSNYWVIIHRAKLQLRACMEINWFNL